HFRRRTDAISAVARVDDIRMVGALAVCLSVEDEDTYRLVIESLERLLPRLKASDSGMLNQDARVQLLEELKHHSDLWIPLMNAYEQVGGEQELPIVEKLARNSSVPLLQEAAQACLPAIR